ncbi:MAG: hypothetical protein LLF94_01310 [Chlamydiales bacterium]|nr:hypothetical protein [Chlamydiales bacterium]
MFELLHWCFTRTSKHTTLSDKPLNEVIVDSKVESAKKLVLSTSSHETHSPIRHSGPKRAIVRVPELDSALAFAKLDEAKRSLQAFIDASNLQKAHFLATAHTPKSALEYLEIRVRAIVDSLGRQKEVDGQDTLVTGFITALTSKSERISREYIQTHLLPIFTAFGMQNSTRLMQEYTHELFYEYSACLRFTTSFAKSYAKLTSDVLSLIRLIDESEKYIDVDPATRIEAILVNLRGVLETPAYGLMRADESNACIRYLHTLVLGSTAHAENLSSSLHLGRAFCEEAKDKIHRVNSLGDIIINARETAVSAGFLEDDATISDNVVARTAERYLPITCAEMISKVTDVVAVYAKFKKAGIPLKDAIVATARHAKAYFYEESRDYRGIYGNRPTALYVENLQSTNGNNVSLRAIVGASPATGFYVQPEFRAQLQAIENRAKNHDDDLPYKYTSVVFTNMQERFHGRKCESEQSEALMYLNERYTSIRASTLPADPLAGYKKYEESLKNILLKQLQSDQAFTLEILDISTNYYFDKKYKERLLQVFPLLVDKAYAIIDQQTDISSEKKIAKFGDLVNLCITRYLEILGDEKSKLVFRNCSVTSDRAWMLNCEMLHALNKKAQVTARIAVSRSNLTKRRLSLKKRIERIASFSHNKQIKEQIEVLLQEMVELASNDKTLKTVDIQYPGCLPEDIPQDPTPRQTRLLF